MAHALQAAPAALAASAVLAADVSAGLLRAGQKTLPCKYLYDEVGTLLFEAICALPEYGLSEADAGLLRTHATAMVAPLAPNPMVAELGSGNGRKSRWLLQALAQRHLGSGPTTLYSPIEISALALARCQQQLADVEGVEFLPLQHEYLEGLDELARLREAAGRRGRPLLVLFLGSTLGNFAPVEARAFLTALRRRLRRGDALLLGLDLVKPAAQLKLAYDDPAGVTAAFNRNLLVRLNRELGANFDLRQWQHCARYDRSARRIEMHLRSRREQVVCIPGVSPAVHFRSGETIWTESSHKFLVPEIRPLLAAAGFRLLRLWEAERWPFAEALASAS